MNKSNLPAGAFMLFKREISGILKPNHLFFVFIWNGFN